MPALQRATLWLLSCAAVVRAFDATYIASRATSSASGDALLHYNAIAWWWRFGDSPRGFTLTPSPSFIDFALQLPLIAVTPDFERFSYALALVYALLITAALHAVLRVLLGRSRLVTAVLAAGIVVAYYCGAPIWFVAHGFTYNHTSEVFTTLGVLAALHALYRPGAPRRRYAPVLYAALVMACTASSPFFIATYCIPASCGVAALLGTPYVTWRRLVWFGVLTGAGAFAGLIVLGAISLHVWPVRGDHYIYTAAQSLAWFRDMLFATPGIGVAMLAIWIAAVAAIVLAIIGRRRWAGPLVFLLAFYPVCVVTCTVLPIKRGAFTGAYELRYLQLPCLLMVVFYAIAALALGRRRAARVHRPTPRRWLAWTAAIAPGVATIALVARMHGPLTMHDPASFTSGMIDCVQAAEKTGLHDGLGTVYVARWINAAMHASDWASPNAIAQIYSGIPPEVMATESNALWFNRGPYRGGRTINYLATHTLDDAVLDGVRTWIGPPDRTITCPTPLDMRVDRKPTFDLWIWDRPEPQRRLAELVTHDNLRAPFVPVVGARSIAIDPTWGMAAAPQASELVGGRRIWRYGTHAHGVSIALIRSFLLPSGRYRAELAMTGAPRPGQTGPLAEVVVEMERRDKPLRRILVPQGATRTVFEFSVKNIGGPTSGDLLWMHIYPSDADELEISGMTITLVELRRLDPFRIFRR